MWTQTTDFVQFFDIRFNPDPRWIMAIPFQTFSARINKKLAARLAGYRLLRPFKEYPCKENSFGVRDAYDWLRGVASAPKDYAIVTATRQDWHTVFFSSNPAKFAFL
jgi:hypothetical protein